MTLVSSDITSGETTFGRLDRSPRPLGGHILGGRLRRFVSIALQFTVHTILRAVSILHNTNLPDTKAKNSSAICERAARFLLRSDTSSEKRLLAFCGFKCRFSKLEFPCQGKLAQVNGA